MKKETSFISILILIFLFCIAVPQSFADSNNSEKLEEIISKNNAKIISNTSKKSNEITASIPDEGFANFIDDILLLSHSQQNTIEIKNIKEIDSKTKSITIEMHNNTEKRKNSDQASNKNSSDEKYTFNDIYNDSELWNGLILFIGVVLPFLGICLVTLLIIIYRVFLEIKEKHFSSY